VKIIPERHRQTDGQTDGQTTYCSITALCTSASRGKKYNGMQQKRAKITAVKANYLSFNSQGASKN